MACPYCQAADNGFVPLNQTAAYSGIEIAVNRQGMLRARSLADDGSMVSQDIVEIHCCPACGRAFSKEGA